MSYRAIFFLTLILYACADAESGAEQPLLSVQGDVEATAQSLLGDSIRLHSAVSSAFSQVKADVQADQFLLFEQIQRTLQQGSLPNAAVLDRVAEELLEQMLMTERDELAAHVHALLRRFAELLSVPRENIPAKRLAEFLDDATELSSEMWVFLNDDRGDRKQTAYYFAPAHNAVVSTNIFALAAAGYPRSTIETVYLDAIETNLHLVGTGEADNLGYLSDWVSAQTPGAASTRAKLDKDPVIYSVRRALEEQQRALE